MRTMAICVAAASVLALAFGAASGGGGTEQPVVPAEMPVASAETSAGGETPAPELPAPIDSPLLQSLLPAAEALDGACALKSLDSAVGATPIPVSANPMITGDRRVVGFVSVFVMPPTEEEEASWEAETSAEDSTDFLGRVERIMEQRIANVRAALVVIYESVPGGAETGIFALEFIEPLTEERQRSLAVEGPGGAILTGDHVAAAVWTDSRERGCLDAVRAHLASVLGD